MNRISRDLRIAVVGAPGCSALSKVLSRQLEIPRIAVAGSEPRDDHPDAVHARTASATEGPSWVIEANDQTIRELVWPRATMIVWLDFRLSRNLRGKLRRGLRRLRMRMCGAQGHGGTYQAPRSTELDQLLDERCVRLRSLGDIRDWLRDVAR